MAATDSMPVPKKGVAFRLYFTAFTAAGVPVSAFTAPDSERSLDGASYADCTNEATYVGHGQGYVDLTAAEMNTDHTGFWFECTEGNIGEPISICPQEAGDLVANDTHSGTAQAGTSNGIQLATGASSVNNYYIGQTLRIVSGTGAGQAGVITAYTGASRLAVVKTWATQPDNTSIYSVLATEAPKPDAALAVVSNSVTGSVTGSVASVAGNVVGNVTGSVGSVAGAVGSVTGAVGSVAAGVTLADDAITAGKFDEVTAFPLKSADTGSTLVARSGADADTLKTLSDQVDLASTALAVAAVKSDTAAILDDTGTAGVVVAAASKSGYALATAPPTVAEIKAAIEAIALSDPASVPAATMTLVQALSYLMNVAVIPKKTAGQTSGTIYNRAGTAIGTKTIGSSGGTVTVGPAT